jgi:hypothetical protein
MHHDTRPAIALPLDVRPLLEAPAYVRLPALRADGRPRNHVVRAGLEGVRVLICTPDRTGKAKDMRRDPRVAPPVTDRDNPDRMAALQGRVAERSSTTEPTTCNPAASDLAQGAHPSPTISGPVACPIGESEPVLGGHSRTTEDSG